MGLRPFQVTALENTWKDYQSGVERLLVVMATGLGKTHVFSKVPQLFPGKRTLVLVHTDELATQAKRKLKSLNPALKVGVEMGASYALDTDDIIVGSVQTLGREGTGRLARFIPDDFGAVIVDECHHASGDTYERVLAHFGFKGDQKCGRMLFGTTATPGRSDGVGLARVFDRISYNYGLIEAINDGWLCNLRAVRVRTSVSLDGVGSSHGDFNKGELSLAVNTPIRNQLVVEQWLKNAERRKTLGFTVTIQHARDLAAEFVRQGVRAEAVWGVDPDRKEKVLAHQSNDIEVLLNAAFLIEGYDDPTIKCIMLTAPTKSQLRYMQEIGRGTRLPEGVQNLHEARVAGIHLEKCDCLILDYTDSTTKHSLVTLPSIFGLPKDLEFRGKAVTEAVAEMEKAVHDYPNTDFSELEDLSYIKRMVQFPDLFNIKFAPEVMSHSVFQWHKRSETSYILKLPRWESITLDENLLGHWTIKGKINGSEFENSEKDLGAAFHTADNMLRFFGKNLMAFLRREAPTSNQGKEPITKVQVSALNYQFMLNGRPAPDLTGMSRWQATKLLASMRPGGY